MFFELLLGTLTFLVIWDYLNKKRRNELFKKAGIKGPTALPLLGNVLTGLRNDTSKVFQLLRKLHEDHGKIWHMWFFTESVIMVQDPKFFEGILSSQQAITKNVLYKQLKVWLGDGLLISTGAKWHARRKVITPTFHFKILEEFVEIFDQHSAVMAEKLYAKVDGRLAVNIFPVVCLAALDIIAETAMGVKVDAQMNPEFPYAKAVTTVADIMGTRFVNPAMRFEWIFKTFYPSMARKLNKSIEIMHQFTDAVIEERRTALEQSIADGSYKPNSNEDDDVGQKKRLAFLDVLLQSSVAGQPLTNADIREEVDTFMFEGHDTTTSGISHCLYLIARHPEVQAKLVQEIREVIGEDKHKPVTMRELQDLKYLECAIKEGLRLYPPVPMIGRQSDQDVVINGHTIPAYTNINLLIYAACRDPDYFTQPDDFIPERFSTESTEKINPFAYVPFSAGPRNCIGQKFAILEMKSTLSKMLRHFELLPLGEEVQPTMNLILRSSTGIHIGLKPRVY